MASWLFPETTGLDAALDFDALDLDALDLDDFELVEGNDTLDGDAIDEVGSNTGGVSTNFATAWTRDRSPFFKGVASARASVSVFFLDAAGGGRFLLLRQMNWRTTRNTLGTNSTFCRGSLTTFWRHCRDDGGGLCDGTIWETIVWWNDIEWRNEYFSVVRWLVRDEFLTYRSTCEILVMLDVTHLKMSSRAVKGKSPNIYP